MSLVDVVNSRCDNGHLYRGRLTLAASNRPLRCSCKLAYRFEAVSLLVIALFLYIFQARGSRYTRHLLRVYYFPLSLFSLPFLSHQETTEFHFPSPPFSLWMKHHVAILVLVCLAPLCGRRGPAPAPTPSQDSGLGRVVCRRCGRAALWGPDRLAKVPSRAGRRLSLVVGSHGLQEGGKEERWTVMVLQGQLLGGTLCFLSSCARLLVGLLPHV